MTSSHANVSDFIWNGLGLTTPDNWEPAALERDSLLLECDGRPVCELKWRTVQGTFSFEKHLKRLSKSNKGVAVQAIPEHATPEKWARGMERLAESGLRMQSFIWGEGEHRGIGAALHNPATGMAALVQFFIAVDADESVASAALPTLRDYSGGKTIPWAMFGLSARVPSRFLLDTFSFKPGHYCIRFWRPKSEKYAGKVPVGKGPGTHLVFERYAPASVLLKEKNLSDWTGETLDAAPKMFSPMAAGPGSVAWNGVDKTSLLRKVLHREKHTRGKVRTTDVGNSILCVTADGVIPVDDAQFNEIVASYELV